MSVRVNEKEAFVFVINHEATNAVTDVELADLGFAVGGITDVDRGAAGGVFEGRRSDKVYDIGRGRGLNGCFTRLLRVTPVKRRYLRKRYLRK